MCKFESGWSIRAEHGFKSDRLLESDFDLLSHFLTLVAIVGVMVVVSRMLRF
ncbi:MAG: hypothetical protein ACYDHY_19260 [Acidiferrobacterales bacterium]